MAQGRVRCTSTASTCSSLPFTTTMSAKQDKATTERHARTLRELLKRPENKACADCKRNGAPHPRSWLSTLT